MTAVTIQTNRPIEPRRPWRLSVEVARETPRPTLLDRWMARLREPVREVPHRAAPFVSPRLLARYPLPEDVKDTGRRVRPRFGAWQARAELPGMDLRVRVEGS